jgi:acrylyl-CoA reductase (NADPH)
MTFQAILIEKDAASCRARIAQIDDPALPDGGVTVQISHSTPNYKDGLAITGKAPIARSF